MNATSDDSGATTADTKADTTVAAAAATAKPAAAKPVNTKPADSKGAPVWLTAVLGLALAVALWFVWDKHSQLQQVRGSLDDVEKAQKQVLGELEAVRTKQQQLAGENAKLSEVTENRSKENESLGQRIQTIVTEHQDLKAAHVTLTEAHATLKTEKAELLASLDDLGKATTDQQTQIKAKTGAVAELQARIKALNDGLTAKTDEAAGYQIQRDQAMEEAKRLKQANQVLTSRMGEARAHIRAGINLERFKRKLTPNEMRVMGRRSKEVGRLLSELMQYRENGVFWGIGNDADNPAEGFGSAGFAGFLLQRLDLAQKGVKPMEALQRLPSDDGEPKPGDIVQYDGGFVLFHMLDRKKKPIVMGMTHHGIVTLDADFGADPVRVIRTGITP